MASAPREDNRVPGLVAKSDADNTPVILEADAATKRLKVSAVITSGGSGSSIPATFLNGQQTTTTGAVALPVGTLTQGVIIEGLSTNVASVWIGNSTLTAANGYELVAGQATSIAVSSLSAIYVLGANSTDKIAWIGS
jgi:hypothetical protein